jgi:hypothetical protein
MEAVDDYRIERPLFFALYKAIVGEAFDLPRFDSDELYAFEVFETALGSENAELRNLASHLQAYRSAAIETISLKGPEDMGQTWLMPVLSIDVLVVPPAPVEDMLPEGILPRPASGGVERRTTMARFTVPEIIALATLQRLFRKEFGHPMDVEQFAYDDPYGRKMLREALASTNLELLRAAKTFVDDEGRFRRHRRGFDPPGTPGSFN